MIELYKLYVKGGFKRVNLVMKKTSDEEKNQITFNN